MEEYIQAINTNPIAKKVKLADRLHNLLCAPIADKNFKERYIKETEKYYLELAKGTTFEEDMIKALNHLKSSITV